MRRILIVGGGATGLIVATNLLRKSTRPTQISIADPRESIGLGVAYSTADTGHVLNVPASR
ncbi:MAG: FAD/NAD(P)-binding protein, partial [Actinomycetota bacterium]